MKLSRLSRHVLGTLLALVLTALSGCSSSEAPSSVTQVESPGASTPENSPTPTLMDFSQRLELRKPQEPIRQDPNVVFLGNSYTFVNDLPGTFQALAQSGGFSPRIAELTDGGYHLSYFADPEDELGAQFYQLVESYPLDYVILQEQSRLPSVAKDAKAEMFPAARTLDRMIKSTGGQTVFLMTWAYKNGDTFGKYGDHFGTTREEMQTQLAQTYLEIADELDALCSPAGIAYLRCANAHPEIELWDEEDNMHPTLQGTYLVACTLYATVFNQSPVGLSYTAGLDADTATILQQVAADLVLN